MKTLFIETKERNKEIDLDLTKLPKQVLIAYSIQYYNLALSLKKKLGKRVKGFQQVLGCSKLKTKFPILLVSTGKFHALNLALQDNLLYYIEHGKIKKFDNKETEKIQIRKRTALIKFLNANNIGILVSTKPGQEKLKQAFKLKKELKKKNKSPYIFIANNLNISELENFPNIESWINTACPGLIYDTNKIINSDDIKP